MNNFQEKLVLGYTAAIPTFFSWIGAIMTAGETRYVYVTFAVSFFTAGFVALMFKKSNETSQLVVGRFGLSVLGGILGTKPTIHWLGFESLSETDIISLAQLSSLCCIITYFCGYLALQTFERMAPKLVEKWFKKLE